MKRGYSRLGTVIGLKVNMYSDLEQRPICQFPVLIYQPDSHVQSTGRQHSGSKYL